MFKEGKSVSERLKEFGEQSRKRLAPDFHKAGISYPPNKITLLGIKSKKSLEVYARNKDGKNVCIKTYPVLGMSGDMGPKTEEGDLQIPEGIYAVESLNPKSKFHVSLRLNYPNEFDLKHAKEDGRKYPGSDIYIHGSTCSVGCLAMGDPASEDLFVLASDTGLSNIKVIITPVDFRHGEKQATAGFPKWTQELYQNIRKELDELN